MTNRTNGHNVRNSLESNPEIAHYLSIYDSCRTIQMLSTEGSRGSGKSQVRIIKVIQIPTGYTVLPWSGGIEDQPYRMWQFFEIFFAAERKVAFQKLSS